MNKKSYFFLIFGFAVNLHAYGLATPEQEQALQAKYNEYLASQGINISSKSVEEIPLSRLQLPNKLKNEINHKMEMMRKQGYIENTNQKIKELAAIEKLSRDEKIKYKNNLNPESTHLRNKPSQIKIAYPFKPVPKEYAKYIYGYAPAGFYTKLGWTGVVELFKSSQLGNCQYEEIHLKISQINISIPMNIITHQINKKTTIHYVEGNVKDGYLYTVEWYDQNFSRKLECLTNFQSKQNLKSIIGMAKKIDY